MTFAFELQAPSCSAACALLQGRFEQHLTQISVTGKLECPTASVPASQWRRRSFRLLDGTKPSAGLVVQRMARVAPL